MPDMNGYEVARMARQEAWGKDIFLLALTGWGQAEDQDKARAMSPTACTRFSKPFSNRAGPDGQANTLSSAPSILFDVSITSAAAAFKALDCCKLVSACVEGALSGLAICEASCDSSCCAVDIAAIALPVAGREGKAELIVFMPLLSAQPEETLA